MTHRTMLLTLSPKKYGRKISLAARKSERSKLIQLYCCFSFMLYWIVGVYVLPEAVFSVHYYNDMRKICVV